MLEKQLEKLAVIVKNEDLQNYAGESFWNFIQAIISQDPFSGITTIKNVKDLVFHMPTVLFWDKMQRFLYGTYKDFEEQVKMAARFNTDDAKYIDFVKKQVYLINEMNDDTKIDYFASLTRCFLLFEMETSLYFKLAKFLILCTPYELDFIKNNKLNAWFQNSAMISILYQYGLIDQITDENTSKTHYELSSFGKALKGCSLNFDDEVVSQIYLSYDSLEPLNIPEPTTWEDIDELFTENTPILNGGDSTIK